MSLLNQSISLVRFFPPGVLQGGRPTYKFPGSGLFRCINGALSHSFSGVKHIFSFTTTAVNLNLVRILMVRGVYAVLSRNVFVSLCVNSEQPHTHILQLTVKSTSRTWKCV